MARFNIHITIITAVKDTLIRLQKVYPSNKIINELLSLFEILQAYEADGSKLTAEERETVSDSCENILRELARIANTLKPYLDPESECFSEEDREKINYILSIDPDYLLKVLDENKGIKNKP